MSIINSAVSWARQIAADDSHGYDQTHRQGPDYDCSSFVIAAYKQAGVPLTCTYTGNMRSDMLRHGFVVAIRVNLSTGAGLQPGDVLLNERNHTAMYIGDGKLVQASINERGTTTGGQTGDQTGREIAERSYYNYPWDCVLRYVGTATGGIQTPTEENNTTTTGGICMVALRELQRGAKGEDVRAMQQLLILRGHSVGIDGADGDFGVNTAAALREFQRVSSMDTDGICGSKTWAKLIGS